eukprot:3556871-Pleurochrysis_carterae.AAC.2
MHGTRHSAARARASIVFPVPGGPESRTPAGGFRDMLVKKRSGCFIGTATWSMSSCLISSCPPMLSNVSRESGATIEPATSSSCELSVASSSTGNVARSALTTARDSVRCSRSSAGSSRSASESVPLACAAKQTARTYSTNFINRILISGSI